MAENDGGTGAKHDKDKLFNGSSLSHLTGAVVSTKRQVEVRLPASSMAEVLETINRLGITGNLQVNFAKGRAMDLKWTNVFPND